MPELVEAQVRATLEDISPGAAKTGALGDEKIVRLIARLAEEFNFPLVVDPVMISKHGHALLTEPARRAMAESLLPRAHLVTPNLHEAAELAGISVSDIESMERAAEKIISFGARGALIKGGHLEGDAVDLFRVGNETVLLSSPRVDTRHTHGTGCVYSACITAELAKGNQIKDAVAAAKEFITQAIATAPGLGYGSGPVNFFA